MLASGSTTMSRIPAVVRPAANWRRPLSRAARRSYQGLIAPAITAAMKRAAATEGGGGRGGHREDGREGGWALPLREKIGGEPRPRWPGPEVPIVHRLGRLETGEPSVAVAVPAPPRGAAFEACRYAIDTLKATVPIWKKEFYADGAVWLEGPGSAPVEVTARAT